MGTQSAAQKEQTLCMTAIQQANCLLHLNDQNLPPSSACSTPKVSKKKAEVQKDLENTTNALTLAETQLSDALQQIEQ